MARGTRARKLTSMELSLETASLTAGLQTMPGLPSRAAAIDIDVESVVIHGVH
jgi:formyltetrahydrofolate synthetase